jgi:hypothetical protein
MTYVVGVPDRARPRLLTGPPLWPNSLLEPTYEKLDHVHIDTDKIPLVTSLEYIEAVSDHAPILVIIGPPTTECKLQFKFELGWLHREGFS